MSSAINDFETCEVKPEKPSPIDPIDCQYRKSLAYKIHDEFTLPGETRRKLLQQHGSFSLAYSVANQTGLSYFGNETGFLAYKRKLGYTFVLGDPIARASDYPKLIADFLRSCRKPCFVQASVQVAEILRDSVFYINEMGYDTRLDLNDYDFAGKQKDQFRYATNWLNRHGFEIKELKYDDPLRENYLRQEISRVVKAWSKTRIVQRESEFLNRPFVYQDEFGVRKFCLLNPEGRVIAFVFFDPIFRNNQIIGYVTAFKRRHPDAPGFAELGITRFAIDRFQAEGVQQLNLGLAPLADVQRSRFPSNSYLRFSMRTGFKNRLVNRYLYNLKGHADFKSKYRGIRDRTYFITPSFFNELRLVAILKLTRVW